MPIAQDVAAIMSRQQLASSQFGIAVYDLDAKRMLFERDSRKYFVAASTTKLITEGTTLALLGPDYKFTTNVYAVGNTDGSGTLHGNIVLKASGDLDLSQRIQPDGTLAFENEDHAYGGSPFTAAVPGDPLTVLRDMAKQISAHGIKRVDGRVIVDDSLFPDNTTEGGTGTGLAPIDVNDNAIDVTIGPGAAQGAAASLAVSPQTAYVTFVNKATTGAPKSANSLDMSNDAADANGNHTVTITGSVPQGSKAILYAYPVTAPKHFAEVALTQALTDAGIAVSGTGGTQLPDYSNAPVVATHVSPPISQDVKITLKVSDNNHAGSMPYIWGAVLAHDSTANAQMSGFKLENQFLTKAGLDPSQIALEDGEGAFAFIRPAFMVKYLAYIYHQPYYQAFYNGLPILGVDGTLFNIQMHAPAAGKVHAKTGTNGGGDFLNPRMFLTGKGLAGYMTTRHGHRVAFCVYLNNLGMKPSDDITTYAGQVLGEIANAAYLDL